MLESAAVLLATLLAVVVVVLMARQRLRQPGAHRSRRDRDASGGADGAAGSAAPDDWRTVDGDGPRGDAHGSAGGDGDGGGGGD
ncbi:MAG TPA: hypothetical protein VLK29_07210 [Luteimonas sp.]|nr:hypothetical protein [Luteimonas sp.]